MERVAPLSLAIRHTAREHGLLLSKQERIDLANAVRVKDAKAREKMILSFLRYCETKAYRYSQMYRHIPHRVEYEDLFQMAVLTVLRVMDQALEKYEDPYSYIFLAVQRELVEYCLWRSHLIRMPETRDEHGGALYDPYEVVDLNDALELEMQAGGQNQDYTTLYEAVEQLSGRFKTVIEMRFGLGGYAPTSLWDVSNAITDGKSKTAAGPYQSQALRKLHKYLEKGA